MNIPAIANIPSSTNWKRTRGRYLAAAVGVALALGAVLAGGIEDRDRARMEPQAAVAAPAQRQVSQADIDAAVLSTEMATYDFSAQPAQQRRVSQADLEAGVLSSELANFPQ